MMRPTYLISGPNHDVTLGNSPGVFVMSPKGDDQASVERFQSIVHIIDRDTASWSNIEKHETRSFGFHLVVRMVLFPLTSGWV